MRKVAFALVHCFQTCLESLACCSMCLILCLFTEIAKNRSKKHFKIARCLRNWSAPLRDIFWSRAKSYLSRAKPFLYRTKSNSGVQFRASLKRSRAACKSVSRDIKLLRATWNLSCAKSCVSIHLFGLFLLFASRTLSLFEFVIVPCPRTVLNNDTLRTWGDGRTP